jgi:hypothetical protein
MVCRSCGRDSQNQNANFCEYCGASFREGVVNEFASTPNESNSYQSGTGNASVPAPAISAQGQGESKKPVSYLNWLGTYCIMLIPVVGGIVFLIMLIVWSVSSNISESKRNWARATLTYIIIMLIIALIIWSMFMSMLRSPLFQEIFQESLNSEMERYNEIFKNFSY